MPESGLIFLDTNILVHLVRKSPLGAWVLSEYELADRRERPLISVVTVGEALAFASYRGWGEKKSELLLDLMRELVVVDLDNAAVLHGYAEMSSYLKKNGRAVGQNDVWIAACTAPVDARLLTTDRDFDPLDARFMRRTWVDPDREYPPA